MESPVPTYMLEAYVPRPRQAQLTDVYQTACAAARARRGRGRVRLLRSYYLPEDETWFLFVDASQRGLVADLGGLLDVAVVRTAKVVTVG